MQFHALAKAIKKIDDRYIVSFIVFSSLLFTVIFHITTFHPQAENVIATSHESYDPTIEDPILDPDYDSSLDSVYDSTTDTITNGPADGPTYDPAIDSSADEITAVYEEDPYVVTEQYEGTIDEITTEEIIPFFDELSTEEEGINVIETSEKTKKVFPTTQEASRETTLQEKDVTHEEVVVENDGSIERSTAQTEDKIHEEQIKTEGISEEINNSEEYDKDILREKLYERFGDIGTKFVGDEKQEFELSFDFDISVGEFEEIIKEEFDITVDFDEELRHVSDILSVPVRTVVKEEEVFRHRKNILAVSDSDQDGVTDYDEIVIYETDPFNAKTVPSDLTDGEKILQGIDPTSETIEEISYEDPREEDTAVIEEYVVTQIVVTETRVIEDREVATKVAFRGRALPNSFVTIYIFSTPIIITVKTNEEGVWTYELDQELSDGSHELYVATVNNSGKIIAKSDPIPFVKEAAAAELGTSLSLPLILAQDENVGFFRNNFVLLTFVIAVLGILVTFVLVGSSLRGRQEQTELAEQTEHREDDNA